MNRRAFITLDAPAALDAPEHGFAGTPTHPSNDQAAIAVARGLAACSLSTVADPSTSRSMTS